MELHQLRTFVAAAEEGRLTKAAERLHISQPALSGHIRALEKELGLALFNRTSKGMELTGEGKALLRRARTALEAVDQIEVQARKLKGEITGETMGEIRGKAKIGLNTVASMLKVCELIGAVAERYPHIGLHMATKTTGQILESIRNRNLDGGFFFGSNRHPEIQAVFLCRADIVVAAPKGWVPEDAVPDWNKLAELPWVLTPEHCLCRQAIQSRFDRCGAFPDKALTVEDDETLNMMIRGGHGIGPMLRSAAVRACERGEVTILSGILDTELSFGLLRSRIHEPVMHAVLEGVGKVWNLDPFVEETSALSAHSRGVGTAGR